MVYNRVSTIDQRKDSFYFYFKSAKDILRYQDKTYKPNARNHAAYQKLYKLYRQMHDAFGTQNYKGSLYEVMKQLLDIKEKAQV